VLVSRLRGLSRYQGSDSTLGLSTQDLNNVLDTVSCLKILTNSLLNYVGMESRQFAAFSDWLQREIEIQAAELSTSGDELADKESAVDHMQVLDYIQGAMTKSMLAGFLQAGVQEAVLPEWDLESDGITLYEMFNKELHKYTHNLHMDRKLPGISALADHLGRKCNIVFKQIAEAEKRNVLFGKPIPIRKVSGTRLIDMRVCYEVSPPCCWALCTPTDFLNSYRKRRVRLNTLSTSPWSIQYQTKLNMGVSYT
jgi:anaphase-promoting complex subunit 4